jgi:uncharacterized protein involved in oxidation of intracellular sulfur
VSKTLLILNDQPYGTGRSYSALRLAGSLARQEGQHVRVLLIGDTASCAMAGQQTPNGYCNLERMLRAVTKKRGEIRACGACVDARGIVPDELAEGTRRNALEELTEWTLWADRALVV